ncbi:alpha/beta hydrolase family protein [Corynebacterium bovis]|uniref:alpha/beta hydrolase family protein n=1 Tax=Corynebacterium bovis TaxID=36808 RepID=UPI000F650D48|nr:prolyl oligopeptidase family serine peptidase [Corynebacterium bovis]RRQ15095.1 hypothetical protein CXF46_09135 [Corynebacterium bovis]
MPRTTTSPRPVTSPRPAPPGARHPYRLRRAATAGVCALTLATAACSSAPDPARPGDTATTSGSAGARATGAASSPGTPSPDHPGRILGADPVTSAAAPAGGHTWRVTYSATGAAGSPTTMSGLVTLPDGPAPEGGFPVVSWAHGTTGVGGRCAPSVYRPGGPNGDALEMVAGYLTRWTDRGYAVVQPDFEGLGVGGGEGDDRGDDAARPTGTYLDRGSLASSVNDLVTAATDHFHLAGRWENIGWSQGGFAALAAASADRPAPGLDRTVAVAPGDSTLVPPRAEQAGLGAADVLGAVTGPNLAFFPVMLGGALTADPALDGDAFLNDAGRDLVATAAHDCIDELRDDIPDTTTGADLLAPDADLTAVTDYLDRQQIARMRPQGPVLMLHGTDDTTVQGDNVTDAAAALRDAGVDVRYEDVPGADHRQSVDASWDAQARFLGVG